MRAHVTHDWDAAEALRLLHRMHLDLVADDRPDLSMRQAAILLTVYLEAPPHTVRGLAARLHVAKPVITRALDTLGGWGLILRKRDEQDRRNVLVQRTLAGALYLDHLADLMLRPDMNGDR